MKLTKIIVDGLFGIFHHEITINNDVGITIIIGENGLGKTVLMEMIEAFFQSKYNYFDKIDFKEMVFLFDNDKKWTVEKNYDDDAFGLRLYQTNKAQRKTKQILLKQYKYAPVEMKKQAFEIMRKIPHIKRIRIDLWEDNRTGQHYTAEQLVNKYDDISLFGKINHPKWFLNVFKEIKIKLIETQRLISIKDVDDSSHKKTVEKYSLDIKMIIRDMLTESTKLTSKLDRTYPNRLIKRLKKTSKLTQEKLNKELEKLNEKRKLLDAVGLMEIEEDDNILKIENPDNLIIDVLMLYVEDSFKKLEIFDELSKKIALFLHIINKRFKHKQLVINKEVGFSFISTILQDEDRKFQPIPVSKLSSGEQNELVLFYLLLFKTDSNSLVLIDEPELSLHISWQNTFISDLKEITKLKNLDIIIATHSPDIIAENWDLRNELTGIE